MTILARRAKDVFAPTDSSGSPRSPSMVEAQQWGILIEAINSYGMVWKDTKTNLDAVTPTSGTYPGGAVTADSTSTNNGFYIWTGSAWSRTRAFPDTAAVLENIGGTANAITADTATGVDPAEIKLLILPDPPGTNTGTTVTITLNGGSAESVKAASGSSVAIGDIIAGVGTMFFRSGSEWRQLFSSQQGAVFDHQGDYSAIVTYTEAQIVTGSDDDWYRLLVASATGDDPVSGGSGNWLRILDADSVVSTSRVRAAGALMDSELTDIVAVKALDQGVATTDSPTFAALSLTGNLTIQPAANSVDQGLLITQSGPSSGSTSGNFFFNHLTAEWRSTRTGTGLPGDPASGTIAAFQVNINVGGANYDTATTFGISTGLIHDQDDTSTGDKTALSSGIYSDAVTLGKLYGGASAVTADANCSTPQVVGFEVDVAILTGGSVDYRAGFNSWIFGDVNATNVDTAYAVGRSGEVGSPQWKGAFTLYTQGGATGAPVKSDGYIIGADHASTINDVIDLSDWTVNGYILNFLNAKLSGGGSLSLGNATTAGGIGIASPASTAAYITYEQNSVPLWNVGHTTTGSFFIANLAADPDTTPFTIDSTTDAIAMSGALGVAGYINGAIIDENAWTAFTPTLASGSGAITTSSSTGRYRRLFGRTVIAEVKATLTTVGTASGALTSSLPITADTTLPMAIYGRETGTTGKSVSGMLESSTTFSCYYYDSSSVFTGGDGTIVNAVIVYEAAAAPA